MIFIDNSNIFKGFAKYKVKADYEKLKNIITRGRNLTEIRSYEGVVYPISPMKKKWYEDLKSNSGYIVKVTFDKRTANQAIEKKIDVKLAIDLISEAYENSYDTAVIVSGDGDFLPVIKKLLKLNKQVEIWAFRYSLANTIQKSVPKGNVFYFENVLSKIAIK